MVSKSVRYITQYCVFPTLRGGKNAKNLTKIFKRVSKCYKLFSWIPFYNQSILMKIFLGPFTRVNGNLIPNITECKENQLTWCFNGKCISCIGNVTYMYSCHKFSLQWRHNGSDNVSKKQPHDCFLNRLFRRRSKKTSKPRVTGLCAGNSPGTGEFPAQMASNAENVSIWWRHHERFG